MNNSDIWTRGSGNIDTFVQQMSDPTYGFFVHGLYIFGIGLALCQLCSNGKSTSPVLNWCLVMGAYVVGPRLPILVPEFITIKVLLLLGSAAMILLAPIRLSKYLSGNDKQRRRIQVALIALLVVVFLVDQMFRRA